MTTPTHIPVGGDRAYDVIVGTGLLDDVVPTLFGSPRQALLVHPVGLADVAARVGGALRAAGHHVTLAPVPNGEAAKTADLAAGLWTLLGRSGFTRSDAVVGVGGGATTDLAGFVAATWLRGVAVVHVPTTLLGMVDAAIGGKTAIDTAEGKNLVGAFHPPAGVVCDLALLATLPREETASGLAEVVKAGFIADPSILDLVERDPEGAFDPDSPTLRDLVERSVRVKARVVSADLRETGEREILNYGHTLGHAIEQVERFGWRHGDAVSVGMVYAAELSAAGGRLGADAVRRHREILDTIGLPTTYSRDRWPAILEAMRVDKKARGATLRFVVLDDVARPALLEGPDEGLLAATYEKIAT
jgi:3-dehydroquinate synthase